MKCEQIQFEWIMNGQGVGKGQSIGTRTVVMVFLEEGIEKVQGMLISVSPNSVLYYLISLHLNNGLLVYFV